jgi:hypothetical protein
MKTPRRTIEQWLRDLAASAGVVYDGEMPLAQWVATVRPKVTN